MIFRILLFFSFYKGIYLILRNVELIIVVYYLLRMNEAYVGYCFHNEIAGFDDDFDESMTIR
jgi:hypothetical protein